MSEKDRALVQRFAHALMGPLTVILGAAEMLQSQSQAGIESSQELVELILSQARRLYETLEDLLATAEVQGGMIQASWSDRVASASAPDQER